MNTLRAIFRLLGFLLALTWYAAPLWVRAALGPIDWQHHQAVRQRFCKAAMRILGIQLTVEGSPYQEGPAVYASNHRSWLDPFAEMSVFWAFPVAKAEVGKLPIVAGGARATGILFVDRGNRNSRQAIMDAMLKALQQGFSILIYPEGTTSTEPATRNFKRGAFTIAAQSNTPLVPVAIAYSDPSYHWGEGMSLWNNFVQIAGEKRTQVKLMIGSPILIVEPEITMATVKAQIDEAILSRSVTPLLASPAASPPPRV